MRLWNFRGTTPILSEGQVLPFDFTAYARVNVGDKSVKAAPGEAFESSEAFPNVNIAPEAYGAKVSTKVLRITGDNGYDSGWISTPRSMRTSGLRRLCVL